MALGTDSIIQTIPVLAPILFQMTGKEVITEKLGDISLSNRAVVTLTVLTVPQTSRELKKGNRIHILGSQFFSVSTAWVNSWDSS